MTSPGFDDYVASHSRGLLRFAYLLCGDRHLAEDLVQEVLIKVHRRWSAIEVANPDAYLRTAIVRTHISWRRRRASRELPADQLPDAARPDAFEDRQADRDEVWAMLAGLSPAQRAVLVLRYFEDLDDQRIAELVGIAPTTVRVHAHRGLTALRHTLAEQALDGPEGQGMAEQVKRKIARSARRRGAIIGGAAGVAVIVVLAIVITMLHPWVDTPPPPAVDPVVTQTTLYYSDGTTVLAQLGGGELPSGPEAIIVDQVLSELTHGADAPLAGRSWADVESGKYRIVTTIDAGAQRALVARADATVPTSSLYGEPDNLQAAAVAVEPGTGRVLAYYGGDDTDYAGWFWDAHGEATGFGAHPAGSSFKVYTLAAALKAGISLNSYWNWIPDATTGSIRNVSNCAGAVKVVDPQAYDGSGFSYNPPACSLYQATVASLNVVFYELTLSVGAANVLAMARDAGIASMWSPTGRQDLTSTPIDQLVPGEFDPVLGIGQYPVTVLDQANAMATFAAGGYPATAHFVTTVSRDGQRVFTEQLNPTPARVLSQDSINDLDDVLAHVSHTEIDGWDSAGKTGVWECDSDPNQNCHVWMLGYTSKLATAVWIGNTKAEQPLVDDNGAVLWGSGYPYKIWQDFMTDAATALDWDADPNGRHFGTPTLQGNLLPNLAVPSPAPAS